MREISGIVPVVGLQVRADRVSFSLAGGRFTLPVLEYGHFTGLKAVLVQILPEAPLALQGYKTGAVVKLVEIRLPPLNVGDNF